ncbi:NIPA-like protein [Nephila pilipes]|uniref:NIPA-like protein n=1 Tax=Nephila pilipes TaxID=299642 RepID=A0A8X6PSI9_NEPPI|nr:NIPA-like protein [Nephila pilipes]
MPVDRKSLDNFFKNFSGLESYEKEEKCFGKRISTYIQGQKWVRRPLVISPAVCSQYGWLCINTNLLECETCGAKLCTPEPKIELYESYKACIEKILENLKASHKTHCPWPLTPAPEFLLKMLPMPKEESLKHFMRRLKCSLEFFSHYPKLKEGISSILGLEKQHVLELCKIANIDSENANHFGISAVSLAATGWTLKTLSSDDQKVFISCDNCQRSIWSRAFNSLTNLKIEETTDSQNDINGPNDENSSSSKIKRLKKDDFDPTEEHRPWCLWIATEEHRSSFHSSDNKISSKEVSEMDNTPGWKLFIKSLLRNVSESQESSIENNPSKEHIRSARGLLDTWTSATE